MSGKILLQELRDGEFELVWSGVGTYMTGSRYTTRLGRNISVYKGYSTYVRVNDLEVSKFYGWRILKAMKKGAKKL